MMSSSMFTTADNSIAISFLDIGSTYYWQVRAVVDGERQEWSEMWSFTVGSENGTPVATSPSDGTIYIDELPVLTWSALSTSSEYRLQVSGDENFSEVLIDATVSGASYTVSTALEENATYYWRVAGNDDGTWTEWSTVSTFVISPITIELTRSWTFYADGSEWTLSVNVSAEDYYTAKYTARTTMFNVNQYAEYVTTTDDAVVEIAEALASMAESKGYDQYTTACFVLSFVQNFTYESDENSTGYEDYPRYPIETLVDGEGDCEDTSALFASLIQAEPFGMDAVLVSLSTPTSDVGHMAVGLYLEDVPSEVSYTFNGTAYTMSEDELLSWDVRTYHFGSSYSYWYLRAHLGDAHRMANGHRGLVLHPDPLLTGSGKRFPPFFLEPRDLLARGRPLAFSRRPRPQVRSNRPSQRSRSKSLISGGRWWGRESEGRDLWVHHEPG